MNARLALKNHLSSLVGQASRPAADLRSASVATKTALILTLFSSSLFATPSVGPITASPTSIFAGTSTAVTVSVQITDPTVIPNGVNLLQTDSSGGSPTILGTMTDSGNGSFQITVSFTPPKEPPTSTSKPPPPLPASCNASSPPS